MAKVITTNFGAVHDALNKLILSEVKDALRLIPDQMMAGNSLCRIVVSAGDDYDPKDVAVDSVWLEDDKLRFCGHVMPPCWIDPNVETEDFEGGEGDEETTGTDWINITDFQYLIDQMADLMPASDCSHDLTNFTDKMDLKAAVRNEKIINTQAKQ